MRRPSFIFSKDDRELLIGILRGEVKGTNGVPIDGYTPKIQEVVTKKGHSITLNLVRQRLHQKPNNQVFWQSVYEVTQAERPGLFKKLRAKQAEEALV